MLPCKVLVSDWNKSWKVIPERPMVSKDFLLDHIGPKHMPHHSWMESQSHGHACTFIMRHMGPVLIFFFFLLSQWDDNLSAVEMASCLCQEFSCQCMHLMKIGVLAQVGHVTSRALSLILAILSL